MEGKGSRLRLVSRWPAEKLPSHTGIAWQNFGLWSQCCGGLGYRRRHQGFQQSFHLSINYPRCNETLSVGGLLGRMPHKEYAVSDGALYSNYLGWWYECGHSLLCPSPYGKYWELDVVPISPYEVHLRCWGHNNPLYIWSLQRIVGYCAWHISFQIRHMDIVWTV